MADGYADEALSSTIMMRRLLVPALQTALLLAACSPSHDVAHRSPAAVVLDGAKNVEYGLLGPEESIAYDIAPAPAIADARHTIDQHLRAEGWTAGSSANSPIYVDNRKGTREPVEQWRGTWRRGENVAEYILERRPDRLHVWGRVGPPQPENVPAGAVSNAVAPAAPEPDSRPIGVGPNEVVVFCGPRGTTALSLTDVTDKAATAKWRFRGPSGSESSGQATVRERSGSKPNQIDASGTHFQAGPYKFTWSPAEVTMTGSRTKPESIVSASSWIYFPPENRATKLSNRTLPALDLSAVCR
jgi:hypothetical protein